MSETQAVRAANEAFYRAFAEGDLAAMEALWARAAPVACIHPGWLALTDREAVIESWTVILGDPPPISATDAVVHPLPGAAFVTCVERVGDIALVATNIFVPEDGAWKIVHHQAGHTTRAPAPMSPTSAGLH